MNASKPGRLVRFLELGTSLVAGICWLCVVGSLILPVAVAIWGDPGASWNLSFPAHLDPEALEIPAESAAGAWSIRPTEAQFDVPVDTWWKGPLLLLPVFALMAFVATLLARMLRTLRDGHPFIPENTRRIRRIGQAILAFEGIRWILTFAVLEPALQALEGEHRIRAGLGIDLDNVFIALCVLVFAEVFRRGTEMQAERDLTV